MIVVVCPDEVLPYGTKIGLSHVTTAAVALFDGRKAAIGERANANECLDWPAPGNRIDDFLERFSERQ